MGRLAGIKSVYRLVAGVGADAGRSRCVSVPEAVVDADGEHVSLFD